MTTNVDRESFRRLTCAARRVMCVAVVTAALHSASGTARAQSPHGSVRNLFHATIDSAVAHHVRRVEAADDGRRRTAQVDLETLFAAPSFDGRGTPEHELYEARKRDALRDLGLSVQANVLENFDPGLDESDGSLYRRRAQVELQWDLLKGGFFESRLQARRLDLEIEEKMLQLREREMREWNGALKVQLEAAFAAARRTLLERRRAVVADLVELTADLYRRSIVPRNELLVRLSEQAEVAVQLEHAAAVSSASGAAGIDASTASDLPLLDIAIGRFADHLWTASTIDELVDLQMAVHELDHHPVRRISVRPSLRYNLYQGGGRRDEGIREYASAGISVALPLQFGRSASFEIAAAEQRIAEREMSRASLALQRQVIDRAGSYREHLHEYLRLYDQRIRLRARIDDAAARRRLDDPSFSPMDVLADVSMLLEVDVRILDRKAAMYGLLLDIAEHLEPGALLHLTTPIDVAGMYHAAHRSRSVYVWSETFEQHTNAFLLETLRRTGIGGHVYLSLGTNERLTQKAHHFTRDAQSAGLAVHLLLDKLTFSAEGDSVRLRDMIAQARTLSASGIHVDAGAQTLEDWDGPSTTHIHQFLQGLALARRLTSEAGLTLTASLPILHDQPFLSSVLETCDEVVLTAYGAHSRRKAMERLTGDLSSVAKEVSIALRPDDFDGPDDLYAYAELLTDTSAIRRIVLSDMTALMSGDLLEDARVLPVDSSFSLSSQNDQRGLEEL